MHVPMYMQQTDSQKTKQTKQSKTNKQTKEAAVRGDHQPGKQDCRLRKTLSNKILFTFKSKHVLF